MNRWYSIFLKLKVYPFLIQFFNSSSEIFSFNRFIFETSTSISRPSWDKTFMVSSFSGGGAQEMTGFFFENNLMKGKKDNNPIPANNFLLVFISGGIVSIFFIKNY